MYLIVYKVYNVFYKYYLYPIKTLLISYLNTIWSILVVSYC